ncbi:MAG: heavy metal translocating P-type ATPase [Spirochaetales bacterium]|jgi:Cd2+/Zn2+-exporting ATPase|nr:heavy metal translocating P-type ATPase [Spirochaetales bacterium]
MKPELRKIIILSAQFAVYGAGFFLEDALARWFFAALWLLAGFPVLRRSLRNVLRGNIFDENFLMSSATACALAIGAFSEAAGVMLFYRFGEFLEDLAVSRSRKSIKALLEIRPDFAEVRRGGELVRLAPEEVRPGDIFVVRPGERIALDAVVIEGRSWVDTSALTGEPVPRPALPGGELMGGSINANGMLTLRALRTYSDSSAARILRLVEEASGRKSKTERFITRFARYYTPAVMGAAVLIAALPPLFLPDAEFRVWLYRALVLLVMSCPCALVVSIPLGYFGGLGGAARKGVLVKGSNFIDVLAKVRTMVFDKTGTLTRGRFSVLAVLPRAADAGASVSEDKEAKRILNLAARAESGSNHPIAQSLRSAACASFADTPDSFEEIPGFGVRALIGGSKVLAGSAKFLQNEGVEVTGEEVCPPREFPASLSVCVAESGRYRGRVLIGDTTRPGAAEVMQSLRRKGMRRLILLSGDTQKRAEELGRTLCMDEARGGLLPQDKFAALEEIKQNAAGKVAYVGDGINDTPVLAGADVGIAMGGSGQDAALESADIVLLDDDLGKLVPAIGIAEKTRGIVRQNIVFSLAVKLLFMTGGVAGIAGLWEAVFADVGVMVLAVLNSLRARRIG